MKKLMEQPTWSEWEPPLEVDVLVTLDEVHQTWPTDVPMEIPWIVRLCEHPASPLGLAGAVTLRRHDTIHIILGRGILPQDEAFVIGTTMGASHLSPFFERIYVFIAGRYYPKEFRFRDSDQTVYHMAVDLGRRFAKTPLSLRSIEYSGSRSLVYMREDLGFPLGVLVNAFANEVERVPATLESRRLLKRIRPFLEGSRFEHLARIVNGSHRERGEE